MSDVEILIAAACDDEHGQGPSVPELTRAITVAGHHLTPRIGRSSGQ